MKKTIILILVCFFTVQGFAQSIAKPTVNRNVELISIVSRLAEFKEYSSKNFRLYAERIENHFKPYQDHELIQLTRTLRQERGIGYDAMMSMAVNLDNNLNRLTNLKGYSFEGRWGKENADKFVALLKQFYEDAKCEQFFTENEELYATVSGRLEAIYNELNIDWYSKFYGKEANEQFIIYSGLGNGGGNYGASLDFEDDSRHVFSIMGAWRTDSLGMVTFPVNNYLPIMIHEFCHSFVNQLIDKYEAELQDSGEKIFRVVEQPMRSQAYGNWKTVLYEALVRASVIKYMKDNDFSQDVINEEVNMQISRSFAWIKPLVEELEKYDSQRDIYPTLESYMPQIVKAYEYYAQFISEYDSKRPYIVSMGGISNNATDVDAETTKIMTFDISEALTGKGASVFIGSKGQDAFPKINKVSYINDNKTIELEVELEKGKEYQFIMKGLQFKTQDGRGIKDYEVNFKTAE